MINDVQVQVRTWTWLGLKSNFYRKWTWLGLDLNILKCGGLGLDLTWLFSRWTWTWLGLDLISFKMDLDLTWNDLDLEFTFGSTWFGQLLHTSALIVLSHNDRGVRSLIMEQSRNRTKIEEKFKIPTSEFYIRDLHDLIRSFIVLLLSAKSTFVSVLLNLHEIYPITPVQFHLRLSWLQLPRNFSWAT